MAEMEIRNLFFPATLVLLSGLVSVTSQAQTFDRINQEGRIEVCTSGGTASRVRDNNCELEEPIPATQRTEIERTFTIDLDRIDLRSCSAAIDVEYYQRNTVARVSGLLENQDCAASSGSYSIFARIRTAEGEIETLEFPEEWQRDDDQPVAIEADYPIGENVELLRLRTRRVVCRCTE